MISIQRTIKTRFCTLSSNNISRIGYSTRGLKTNTVTNWL